MTDDIARVTDWMAHYGYFAQGLPFFADISELFRDYTVKMGQLGEIQQSLSSWHPADPQDRGAIELQRLDPPVGAALHHRHVVRPERNREDHWRLRAVCATGWFPFYLFSRYLGVYHGRSRLYCTTSRQPHAPFVPERPAYR